MKLMLGGKLTVLVAALCAAVWLTLLSAPPDAYHVQVYGGNAIFILSMPLGYLSGMFSHTDAGRASELWLYLLLMIPNCFLIGYTLAGLITLFKRMNLSGKRFTIGFLSTILAFGVVNFVSFYVRTDFPGAADAIRRVGFPFLFLEEGGFAYRHHFSQVALWSNIAVAVLSGSVVGLLLLRYSR